MPENKYTFVPDLFNEGELPETAMTSRILHKDERFNITLFGFAAGHELKTHSVPIPALIYVVEGEGEFDLGGETVQVKAGSFIRMEPLLPHALRAETALRMLLVQVKGSEGRR